MTRWGLVRLVVSMVCVLAFGLSGCANSVDLDTGSGSPNPSDQLGGPVPPGSMCVATAIGGEAPTTTNACANPMPVPTRPAPVVKADVRAEDQAFCERAASFAHEFGGNQTELERKESLSDDEKSQLQRFLQRWRQAVAELDALAPPDVAPAMHEINAFVQTAPDRIPSQPHPDPGAAAENRVNAWVVAHCGFDTSGQSARSGTPAATAAAGAAVATVPTTR